MTRDEAKQLDEIIRMFLFTEGHDVNWMMDSGKVVMCRDGRVKLSYSERESMDNARAIKRLIEDKVTPKNFKVSLTNMLETYRPEVRITVTFEA